MNNVKQRVVRCRFPKVGLYYFVTKEQTTRSKLRAGGTLKRPRAVSTRAIAQQGRQPWQPYVQILGNPLTKEDFSVLHFPQANYSKG